MSSSAVQEDEIDRYGRNYYMTAYTAKTIEVPLFLGAFYFVASFAVSFLKVFGSLALIVMAYVRAASSNTDAIGWYSEDADISLYLGLYNASLTYFFLVTIPGLLAQVQFPVSQYFMEFVSQWRFTRRCCRLPGLMFFLKMVVSVAGILAGGYFAAWSLYSCLNTAQRTSFQTIRQNFDNASGGDSSNQIRTILLTTLFSGMFYWAHDSLFRVSPQGRMVPYARTPMYSFQSAAQLVALSEFVGILVLFPITGGMLNFVVMLSLNIYWPTTSGFYSAVWYFVGEQAGSMLSLIMAGKMIYWKEFFKSPDSSNATMFGHWIKWIKPENLVQAAIEEVKEIKTQIEPSNSSFTSIRDVQQEEEEE